MTSQQQAEHVPWDSVMEYVYVSFVRASSDSSEALRRESLLAILNKVFFIYFSTFYLLYSIFPLASTCCYSLLAIARTTPYIEYVSIRVWLSSSRTSARAAPVEKDSQFRKIHFLSAFLSIETKKSGSRPSPSVRQTAEFSNFKYAPNWRITRLHLSYVQLTTHTQYELWSTF